MNPILSPSEGLLQLDKLIKQTEQKLAWLTSQAENNTTQKTISSTKKLLEELLLIYNCFAFGRPDQDYLYSIVNSLIETARESNPSTEGIIIIYGTKNQKLIQL
ncbi:MAG: hypothetical protein K0S32_3022 [Bacteroidetes bacterium]|jgi:hypothetical protein|nr:hypothetical protein [Bacteroidota bacterium]